MIRAMQTIPGPAGSYFLGSLREFRADMLRFLSNVRHQYGTVVRFRLGPRRIVLVSDPDLIEDVLVAKNKQFKKHYATRLLSPILGQGLLLSEGAAWLRQRRLVQPAFSKSLSSRFSRVVLRHVNALLQNWRRDSRRDLYHDMTRLTVSIAADAFLGVNAGSDVENIGDCLETIHADFEYRFQRAWNLPSWAPTPRNLRLRKTVAKLTRVIDAMIERRQHDYADHEDALSLLLAARDEDGQPMPRQLLRDEMMTLLLAGHDTTANALTWAMVLLANEATVVEGLRNEQQERAGESIDLPFAAKVVKEVMRLYPPVYLFGRQATEDMELGQYSIRKNENVLLSQWVVHRDPLFFPKPLEFDPNRWTDAMQEQLPRYAYFPFGGGPRVCLGKDMAMIEAGLILSETFSRFTVKLVDEAQIQPWPTVTLRPKGAVNAVVTERSR